MAVARGPRRTRLAYPATIPSAPLEKVRPHRIRATKRSLLNVTWRGSTTKQRATFSHTNPHVRAHHQVGPFGAGPRPRPHRHYVAGRRGPVDDALVAAPPSASGPRAPSTCPRRSPGRARGSRPAPARRHQAEGGPGRGGLAGELEAAPAPTARQGGWPTSPRSSPRRSTRSTLSLSMWRPSCAESRAIPLKDPVSAVVPQGVARRATRR